MAYFSNGSEGMVFHEECTTCPLGEEPCLIAGVHLEFNYKQCNNEVATAIMNSLVKQGPGGEYIGCQMKRFVIEVAGPAFKTPVFPEMRKETL